MIDQCCRFNKIKALKQLIEKVEESKVKVVESRLEKQKVKESPNARNSPFCSNNRYFKSVVMTFQENNNSVPEINEKC